MSVENTIFVKSLKRKGNNLKIKTMKEVKETYVKPESEIIHLELEQPILTASGGDWGNGGVWG